MADFRRYLPLSYREPHDESDVSSDWRPLTAQSLSRLADLLQAMPEAAWQTESMRPLGRQGRMTVAAAVDRLARRVESSRFELLFPSGAAERAPEELIAALRRAALSPLRKGMADLVTLALTCYDVAHPLGLPDPLDSKASGAAVLARAASADSAIRSIVRQRTLAPTDATWRIGTGPEIRGTAAVLLLWLAGRDVLPDFE